jgi:HAD superfamily hydrolase (TIGR01509 family)
VIAILDVDGTLVDTNYQHALAWYRAFRDHEIVLQLWRIHRHIGMGGDQMIQSLTDEQTERKLGDSIREAEKRHFSELVGEVETMPGSRELLEDLKQRGHVVILASSAREEEVDHYLDLLDARELADDWTTAADVEATKPAPDLVQCALDRAGAADAPGDAVMIGDSPWDVEAALNADVPSIGVRTGGFAGEELRDAGAVSVFESVDELREQLHATALR